MRLRHVLVGAALAAVGCKKSGGSGGGGGGGWLVGTSGLIAHVDRNGVADGSYHLSSDEDLHGIACRYAGEAWVVGTRGTLLYTSDAGATWKPQPVPTTADLRAVATQDSGPVFIGGDGVFLVSTDTGASWTSIGDDTTRFRSIAAAQAGDTVLALGDDGTVWSYDGTRLARSNRFTDAHAIAVSPDGAIAIIAGRGLFRSTDAGATWESLAAEGVFDDVRIGDDGAGLAVGAGGAIANIDESGLVAVQYVGTSDLHAVHVADTDSADATGYAAGEGGQVLITHDAGASWTVGQSVGRSVSSVDEIGIGHR